jgi:hypothetical protein
LRENVGLGAEGVRVDGEAGEEPAFFAIGELVNFLEISSV